MCGIIGASWINKPVNIDDLITAGFEILNHRGPDDRGKEIIENNNGTLFLGQTRLSIIDLTEGGHQPMSTRDGNYTIVFNGEIYNYKELRIELSALGHQFFTESDTEVLLEAWAEWGDACLHRLIGMFSFAIFDNKRGTLSLVRDAFGIKPLFYSHYADHFCFASEIQAVMLLNDRKVTVNNQRVFDYLVYGIQDVGDETFIKEIKHVPPSHLVTIYLNATSPPTVKKWWNPSIKENRAITFSEAAEKLRELFLDSIRLHLRSDVPLGIALSGGIDSSAIACAIRYLEPNIDIHTFSFIPEGSKLSEEQWIDLINQSIQAIPHKAIVKPQELSIDIEDLIDAQGEPFCTTSMYAQYRVFKLAREAGVTVVLEGQGADELLAGYQGYHGQRMRSLFERGDWVGMLRFAKKWKQWEGRKHLSPWRAFLGQVISDDLFKLAQLAGGEQNIPQWLDKNFLNKATIMKRPVRMKRAASGKKRRVTEVLLDAMINNGLPSLLRYGDRNAMHFSIENRVPFLTIPLAEFVLSLPEEYLISGEGETKSVFREAMRGIVPDLVLDRRDKVGFFVPMGTWVSQIRKNSLDTVNTRQELQILDFNKLTQLRDDQQYGESMPFQDWRVLNLLFWVEHVLLANQSSNY
jgi:asparagine synthase (glutamine-hydrolysing)